VPAKPEAPLLLCLSLLAWTICLATHPLCTAGSYPAGLSTCKPSPTGLHMPGCRLKHHFVHTPDNTTGIVNVDAVVVHRERKAVLGRLGPDRGQGECRAPGQCTFLGLARLVSDLCFQSLQEVFAPFFRATVVHKISRCTMHRDSSRMSAGCGGCMTFGSFKLPYEHAWCSIRVL